MHTKDQRQPRLTAFPPVATTRATVLILGSMPGVASLAASQYYAHPRNAFWPIMERLVMQGTGLDYEQRIAGLHAAGIALWDVLKSCARPGSLDTSIVKGSEVVNDFAAFFDHHRRIRQVIFNGAKAEQLFKRHVCVGQVLAADIRLIRLPSTSPAHASLKFEQKLNAWKAVLTESRAGLR